MSCVLRGIERGVRKLGLGGRRNLGLGLGLGLGWVVRYSNSSVVLVVAVLTPKPKVY